MNLAKILAILITISTTACDQTNLSLTSDDRGPIQIPILKSHSHSCELISFVVSNKKLSITISKFSSDVHTINISLQINKVWINQSCHVGSQSINKQFDFSNQGLSNNKSEERTIKIITHYNDSSPEGYDEERKVYLLFPVKQQSHYDISLPVYAISITQLIGLIFIFILPLNIQYRQFLPLSFNLLTCALYIIVLVVALYLTIIFGDNAYQQQRWIIAGFGLICSIMYTQDLLLYLFEDRKIVFVMAFIFGFGLIICDELVDAVEGSWMLNDIISILVAGTYIKFVIIRKIKTAIWALALMWAFCCFRQYLIYQIEIQQFDQGMGIKILPLFLQFPSYIFDDEDKYICSAFGSSKVICFGVLLNYCKRLDLYLSTNFYKILGYVLATLCIGIQLISNLYWDQIPTLQVLSIIIFYPTMIILMLFFANKRGQWAEVWHGSFYDMAVNRAQIPRQVSFDRMQNFFGNSLITNSNTQDRQNQ